MKVFSKTHVLTIAAAAFVVAMKGADGKPLPKTNLVQAPPGTLLEIPDDEASRLVNEGLVEKFNEDEHEAVDGKVAVASFQRIASGEPLPEGMTRPSVVRQDETLNDGRTVPAPIEPVVVGDTKENADRAAAEEAARKAAAGDVAAEAGNAKK